MSGGITVTEFKHIPGVNDTEYIKKLEELREIDKGIINAAVAKIKRLSAQLKEQPEIIRCKECRYYEWMSNRVPDEQTWFCHNWNAETGKDDYCSYAERREE